MCVGWVVCLFVCFWDLEIFFVSGVLFCCFVFIVWFVLVGSFNLVKCAYGLFSKEDFIAVQWN